MMMMIIRERREKFRRRYDERKGTGPWAEKTKKKGWAMSYPHPNRPSSSPLYFSVKGPDQTSDH